MRLTNRIERLEALNPPAGNCHRIIQHLGMTEDEAIAAYGRDSIAPDDTILLTVIVAPKGMTNEA
jgi:hypothetical protein